MLGAESLKPLTVAVLALGIVAFGVDVAAGVLFG